MSRLLAARVAKLEARHRIDATKVIGVLNYCDSQGWPRWDGVHRPGVQVIGVIGGTRIPREDWPEVCAAQQQSLMAELAGYAALLGDDEPQADAPAFVGTVKDKPAPLPEGKKRAAYIYVGEKEIEVAKFIGFTR
ncbi:MAG: hypothetical protein ACK4VZ_11475 [Paracoccaceae bacterium]